MTRLSRNDEAGLRMMAAQAGQTGSFAASISCLRGLLGEIDWLRQQAGIEPPEEIPGAPFKGVVTEGFGQTREVRVPAEDDLL